MRVVSQSKDVSLDFDRAVFTANHGMITAMVDGKMVKGVVGIDNISGIY